MPRSKSMTNTDAPNASAGRSARSRADAPK
jgi:hypothetical protein